MRRAFTLVELLVAMLIIGIIAAIGASVWASARTATNIDATRHTVDKLRLIVAAKLHSFETRRLPIDIPANASLWDRAAMQLRAKRDLMRMELPDRWHDVDTGPVYLYPMKGTGDRRSAVSRRYKRIYDACTADPSARDANAAAECLYMIVAAIPESAEQFHESEIADTDNDGLPEFVDAWGRPIRFLRWAPGYRSDAQKLDGIREHDPFDNRWIDKPSITEKYRGCLLMPLIYSAGPDGMYDVDIVDGYTYGQTEGYPDPYVMPPSGHLIGSTIDDDGLGDSSVDNITSHDAE